MEMYIKPEVQEISVDETQLIMTSDNGNHYGWDNPNNPHYEYYN